MKSFAAIIFILSLVLGFSFFLACDNEDNDNDAVDDDDDTTDDDSADDDALDDDAITDDDTLDDDTDDDDDVDPDDFWPDQPPEPANDACVFVSVDGDDANPGTMSAPKATVQAGVDLAAQTGKVVFVAQGTYCENVTTSVSLYGGYEAETWTHNPQINQTVIEAVEDTPAILANQNATLTIEGFYLIAKVVYSYSENCVEIYGVVVLAGRVRLRDNYIVAPDCIDPINYMVVYSHGILIRGGMVRVERNTVHTGMVGSYGGGVLTPVYVDEGAQAEIVGNILTAGQGIWDECLATAVFVQAGARALIVNNMLSTNYASLSGALISFGNTLTLHNTMKVGLANAAFGVWLGGGEHVLGNNIINSGAGINTVPLRLSAPDRTSVQLFGNDLNNQQGGALMLINGETLTEIDAVNACQWFGCELAEGNIAQEPALGGDLYAHLTIDSPCIDAGLDPSPWYDGAEIYFDFDGDERPFGDGWDIGMDEAVYSLR